MEPECLEPLNLVIKKDSDTPEPSSIAEDNNKTAADNFVDDKIESKIEDNMAILQDAFKSAESGGVPAADQKFLTALYMSSLMQASNASALRNVSPAPYNVPQNFIQLLAALEARNRMWQQQLNWSVPPNFLRNPVGLPQHLYDGSLSSLNEQLCNSPNSLLTYPQPPTKHEPTNNDTKETFKRYINIIHCQLIRYEFY